MHLCTEYETTAQDTDCTCSPPIWENACITSRRLAQTVMGKRAGIEIAGVVSIGLRYLTDTNTLLVRWDSLYINMFIY